jgi:hypothetical protein
MISRFLLDLTAFASAGILCVLPIAQMRAFPPAFATAGLAVTAPSPGFFPAAVAIVQPSFEFQLVKGVRLKRRKNGREPRPAWILLYFIILAVLYLYHHDKSNVITIVGSGDFLKTIP